MAFHCERVIRPSCVSPPLSMIIYLDYSLPRKLARSGHAPAQRHCDHRHHSRRRVDDGPGRISDHDYSVDFGVQSVKLASIWERGTARMIDLAMIVLSVVANLFALNSLLKPEWYTFADAVQYFDPISQKRMPLWDHPSVAVPLRILVTCATVLAVSLITIIVMQGRCGFTPGKWLLGLRTIRATLRPCGFSHSQFRELLMCVDCLNFLCWTPGILSIAFTQNRQRIGDCLADTFVVRKRLIEAVARSDRHTSGPNSPDLDVLHNVTAKTTGSF